MPVFAWLTPRGVIEHAGPWDESLSLNDDGEYFTRVVLASGGIFFSEEAKGYYRTAPLTTVSKRRDLQAAESDLRAAQLSCRHLLAANSGPVARRACAAAMKRVAYSTYAEHPGVSAQADRMVEALGGSDLPFSGGWATKVAVALVGWRWTCRLRQWKRRLRSRH